MPQGHNSHSKSLQHIQCISDQLREPLKKHILLRPPLSGYIYSLGFTEAISRLQYLCPMPIFFNKKIKYAIFCRETLTHGVCLGPKILEYAPGDGEFFVCLIDIVYAWSRSRIFMMSAAPEL